MEFNYTPIEYVCDCGRKPHAVKVGITSLGELAAFWVCNTCKQRIMCRLPLEKLIADIPEHPQQKLLMSQSDDSFLKMMHIAGGLDIEREEDDGA